MQAEREAQESLRQPLVLSGMCASGLGAERGYRHR
jgi:hypothetical protein